MLFVVSLCSLALTAVTLHQYAKISTPVTKHPGFEKLQSDYLTVYYLATFADWLQGPYVYKVYSDYGFEEEEIAVLYIAGFASSSFFGAIVGHFADKYGRKKLCASFGVLYSLCCLTKLSPHFYVLFMGRILGGVSTSILFSTFDAWYINEHINYLKLPQDWINITFSKAGFAAGFLAIIAGITSQISAEALNLGSVSPFIIAIPFLLTCSQLVFKSWEEHSSPLMNHQQSFFAPVTLILCKDRILLILGLILSMFEAVMYTFIFSWTPILSELSPPYGIVFASFMLAFMIGSKTYGMWLSSRVAPEVTLILTVGLSLFSIGTITQVISYVLHYYSEDSISKETLTLLTQICFVFFLLYEFALGAYFPVIGFLKSKVLPEEHRASLTNWFRAPMNIFTCCTLILNRINSSSTKHVSHSVHTVEVFKKFHLIYIVCTGLLVLVLVVSFEFKRRYARKFSKACYELINTLNDDTVTQVSS